MLTNGTKTLLENTDSVYISFADLFMCLLVVQMFLINPPGPQTVVVESAMTSAANSSEAPPVMLYLHNDGRLSSWQDRDQDLEVATIKQIAVKEKANSVVLITAGDLPISIYRDSVIRLEPLGLAVAYAQETEK